MARETTDAPTIGGQLLDVTVAAEKLAQAVAREAELHSLKGVRKSEAICRIIGQENAETEKPHSASSAEKIVESDATYARFLNDCRDSVVARIRAEAEYEVAKLQARLSCSAHDIVIVGGVTISAPVPRAAARVPAKIRKAARSTAGRA